MNKIIWLIPISGLLSVLYVTLFFISLLHFDFRLISLFNGGDLALLFTYGLLATFLGLAYISDIKQKGSKTL